MGPPGLAFQIGLLGPPNAGLTGLVRSLVAEACEPEASLFAARWRIDVAADKSNPNKVHEHAAALQRTGLLTHLTPEGANWTGEVPQRDARDPAISTFTLLPVGGEHPFAYQPPVEHGQFQIFDISRARQNRIDPAREPGWVTHAYEQTSHIVLCQPVIPEEDQDDWWRDRLARLYQRMQRESDGSAPRLRTLVVAFTKYDRLFLANPRQALQRARTPAIAHAHLSRELDASPQFRKGLAQLSALHDLRIVAIPVSVYGFVQRDGKPNCDFLSPDDNDPIGAPRTRLLTRPDIYCRQAPLVSRSSEADQAPTSVQIDWLMRHWRPFLTADPFIASLSGDSHPLVFAISDLLDKSRVHRVA